MIHLKWFNQPTLRTETKNRHEDKVYAKCGPGSVWRTDFDLVEIRCPHALCRTQLTPQPGPEVAWVLLRPKQARDEQIEALERMLGPLRFGVGAANCLHTVVYGPKAGGKPHSLRSGLREGRIPMRDVSD